ncbi:MAG: sigma-54-dependent Fis family transcriptional regulator [Elusimicrobia bacterium]|nr:sigma-54-dependent Fis family transcriptional regulator [Elusimicrobiota bacterium]
MIKKNLPRILVVDDEPAVGMIFHRILGEAGYEVISAASGVECLRVLKRQDPKLVFMDLQMPGMDGVETLRRLRETHPSLPVIIMTAYQTVNSAVETMKLGALDYLIKPLEGEKLTAVVKQALEVGKVSRLSPVTRDIAGASGEEVIARGAMMQKVMSLVNKVAPTDIPVLILGESGTGKEVTARSVHRLSQRADKPFVVVDCAALPESLIESELFGYEKGAFTGADVARAGKFEQANAGTLFLDEIGNLPLHIQVKLLRFLQEPKIERLGSRKGPVEINVRILVATNSDLERAVGSGTFREDLYHRLKVFVIELPALRHRGPEDLDGLLINIVDSFRKQLGKTHLSVSAEAMALLKAYRWPGNVRELQNALRSATLLAEDVVLPEHLPMSIQNSRPAKAEPASPGGLNEVIRRVEREHIGNVLKMFPGDQAAAARELGLDIGALELKLKELDL